MSVSTAVLPSEIDEKPSIKSLSSSSVNFSLLPQVSGPEDAIERIWVSPLDLLHRVGERGSNVHRCLTDVAPMTSLWHLEAMDLREL